MTARILLDTGPLVAFLNRSDEHHKWATSVWETLRPPLITCESVISEACFLLRGIFAGPPKVLDLVARGIVTIPFEVEDESAVLSRLMAKYASVPMSLADACLVRLLEKTPDSRLMTCDRDFLLYRKHGRQVIPTITPGSLA